MNITNVSVLRICFVLLGLAAMKGQAQTITDADRTTQQAHLEAFDIQLEDGGLLTVANGAVQGDDPGRGRAAFAATIVFDNMPGDAYDTGIGSSLSVGAPLAVDTDHGMSFIPSATGTLTDVWLAVGQFCPGFGEPAVDGRLWLCRAARGVIDLSRLAAWWIGTVRDGRIRVAATPNVWGGAVRYLFLFSRASSAARCRSFLLLAAIFNPTARSVSPE